MPNYGNYPYEEAAAKGQARMSLLQRIGQAFAGAGYGIAASQNAQNPLEALGLGFAGSYGKVNAARQAAEEYAAKKIEAQQVQAERQSRIAENEARAKAAGSVKPPPPPDPLIEEKRALLMAQAKAAEARATSAGQPRKGAAAPKPKGPSQSKIDKLARETFALQNADDPAELIRVSNDAKLEPETRQRAWAKYMRLTNAVNPSQVR